MPYLDVASVTHSLPDGRPLLSDVSFRVGERDRVALVGANGAGKTTLLRIVIGDLKPDEGAISRDGTMGVMRQFLSRGTVTDVLLQASPTRVRDAGVRVAEAEAAMTATSTEASQIAYAEALAAKDAAHALAMQEATEAHALELKAMEALFLKRWRIIMKRVRVIMKQFIICRLQRTAAWACVMSLRALNMRVVRHGYCESKRIK